MIKSSNRRKKSWWNGFFDDVFLENSFNIMNDFKKDTQILLFDEIGNNELHLKDYSDKLISYFQEYKSFCSFEKGWKSYF